LWYYSEVICQHGNISPSQGRTHDFFTRGHAVRPICQKSPEYSNNNGILKIVNIVFSGGSCPPCPPPLCTALPHLVSSQIPHILIYTCIYAVKQSLCTILNSQNIAGKYIANEQYHRKLMLSGDIELNPGPVFL
jgi:hypothetical protein